MTKIAIITDAALLHKESKLLANSIIKNDARIHAYLVSEVAHLEAHRNTTRLNEFFTKIKKAGARTDAMHKFIQLNANVSLNKPDRIKELSKDRTDGIEMFYSMKAERPKEVFAPIFEAAKAKMWTEWKAVGEVQDYTLSTAFESLLKNALNKSVNPTEGQKVDINPDMLEAMQKLAVQFGIVVEVPKKKEPKAVNDDTAPAVVETVSTVKRRGGAAIATSKAA